MKKLQHVEQKDELKSGDSFYFTDNLELETEKDRMVKRYLKKIDEDMMKSEDAYLDFLEKIISMKKYSYLPKWLKEYKEFTNSCRRRIVY